MVKILIAALAGGLAFWAIEKYALSADGKFMGMAFETDADGKPKLSAGYIALGASVVLGAVAVGMAAHKVTGGKIPAGIGLSH
jgi:hypothetical protein